MPRVRAGDVHLGWREWGEGETTVVFIHGNLASKDWIALAAPLFPRGVRVVGIDWQRRQRPSASGQGLYQLFDASACARHVARA